MVGLGFLSGTRDELWRNDVLEEMKKAKRSDFEAVDVPDLFVAHQSALASVKR
jgi:hypothetical protein